MKEKIFTAKAPASVANLGPGFDLLGAALSKPWDSVTARWNSGNKIVIDKISGDGQQLSQDPGKNVIGIVAAALREKRGIRRGITLSLKKGIPFAAGLGGSAASSVAAALAVNALLGSPYSKEELLPFAMKGEAFVSGDVHWDNILPALLGGLILLTSKKPLRFLRLKYPKQMKLIVITPNFSIETKKARRRIPHHIPLELALKQSAALAHLLFALQNNQWGEEENICLDFIAEPKRASLIPGLLQSKENALKAGAYGSSISGSGPSLFALCKGSVALTVAKEMAKVWEKNGMETKSYITSLNPHGAFLIK